MSTTLDQAIIYFNEADYENAEKLITQVLHNHPLGHAYHKKALFYQSYIKCELEKYNEAKLGFSQLLNTCDNLFDKATYTHQLAMVERLSGDYLQAYQYIQEEEKMRSNLPHDDCSYTAIYYEYSQLALLNNQIKDARVFIEQSLNYALLSKDDVAKACAYRGFGQVHEAMSDPLEAIENYRLSQEHFIEANDKIAYKDVLIRSEHLIKKYKHRKGL